MTDTVQELKARLEEAEELLRAIRSGSVDALVVSGPQGDHVHTLSGAEYPYRVMVEVMSEGALIITADGTIFYSNHSFAAMVDTRLDEVMGSSMDRFVLSEDLPRYKALIQQAGAGISRGEIRLTAKRAAVVPAYLSISPFEPGAPARGACVVVTDLTEHKRSQELISAEALARAKHAEAEAGQRRIKNILESITDAFVSMDHTWRITDVNERAAACLGRTRDELIGSLFWDISKPGIIHELDEQYHRAVNERIAVHFEGPSAAVSGKWFERHIYPTAEGVAMYFRDITERKQAEAELRRSEAHLAEAQRIGHIGSWTWNVSTGKLFWSAEHYRMFGVDPASFQPTKETTQRLIHPEDLPRVEDTIQEAIRERSDFEVEYRIVRSDGSIRHHRGLGRPVVREPGDLEFTGTVVDITERKQAEEKLRRSESLLAEGQRISRTGSWVWNVSTGELVWSVEHFRICGVDPAAFALTPETAQQLIHAEDRLSANQALENAMHERSDFEQEFRIVRPDGTIRYVFSLGHPVFSDTGELTEYVGTIFDITDRKEDELARQELRRRLVVAQEDERRRIVLEMHDQFGQELSALTLKLSALKSDAGRRTNLGKQLASLETIARQLDTDLELIISRLRPPALDDLGLAAALTNYVKRWSEHFEIQTQLHLSGMERNHLTDEIQTALYRITQEALNNVAKHAQAKSVAILLEARPDGVSLIVEDDGAGFDVQQAIGMRQRFGVMGMRERSALLGGTLDIESRPGQGTTVVARIPQMPDPE